MSTIWKAFLPAHCLQQSQITESIIHLVTLMIHFTAGFIPADPEVLYRSITQNFLGPSLGQPHTCWGPPLPSMSSKSQVMLLGEELLHSPQSPGRGICFGRSSSFQPQRHITWQPEFLLSVTHEICSTLDFAMIEGENLSSGLCL